MAGPPLDRRRFLLGLGGSTLLVAAGSRRAAGLEAESIQALQPERIERLLQERLGRFDPVPGNLRLELPALAESGNSVGVTLSARAPENDPVRRMLAIAPRNPLPLLLEARFGALASPRLTTKIRLAESQTVLAYAQLASGTVWSTRREIEVTIGACQALDFQY